MKLLMENWRKYLNEGMKMPEDLEELRNIFILVDTRNAADEPEGEFVVTYMEGDASQDSTWKPSHMGEVTLYKNPQHYRSKNVSTGRTDIPEKAGPCLGAWTIGVSASKSGWGPMLYDVAIEMASKKHLGGAGVVPDRTSVSGEARGVWDYYLNNRDDVQHKQLDNIKDPSTPDESDDCLQTAATKSAGWDKEGIDYQASPLSKVYTKPNGTMVKKLMSLGKLAIR